ncbi:MAG: cytochrome P460 family protein [Gammaproteobacteria bacterium]|jgi:hypothetical protein
MGNLGKIVTISVIGALLYTASVAAETPFGGENDQAFAATLWNKMEQLGMVGTNNFISSRPYKGAPPHGMILDLLEKQVSINGVDGALIVKKNYGGDGLSVDDVINNPQKYLKAITVMFKREGGYDDENQNWFYAKYAADGTLLTNPKGAKLAGRVAKGAPTGCIACHKSAPGNDFVFNHDRYK